MKRFLADMLLVLLLVSLGSYIMEPKQEQSLTNKVDVFEHTIAQHQPIEQMVDDQYLKNIHENKAARLAKAGSDAVISIMDTSLSLLSELFQGFMQ